MRFWVREVLGWGLVALGLGVFYLAVVVLLNQHVVEAGPLTLIGIVVFRGGIHLLKVAVAARVCMQARQEAAPPGRPAVDARPSSLPPGSWRPVTSPPAR